MQRRASVFSLLFLSQVVACGAATPPAGSPQQVEAAPSQDPASGSGEAAALDSQAPAAESAPPASAPGGVKKAAADTTVPDDYAMTISDCRALGSKLGAVTRSDELAKLSPKLKAAARDKAAEQIETMAREVGEKWTRSCENNLVDKIVDQPSLRCALSASTVKAFDVCLNGEAPAPRPKRK